MTNHTLITLPIIVVATTFTSMAPGATGDTVGQRPYEMAWANRTQDHCPPLVDFEDLAGWRVEGNGAVATFERSREQQLWGGHVGKLTYRGTTNAPQIRLLPPQPIPITAPFDAVTLWCYGNNWGYARDVSTPPVGLSALFEDAAGREFAVSLYSVNWKEWYLLHKRLGPEEIARVRAGAKFKALLITGGRNKEDRVLYFDNLAVFTEQFPPLKFEPRPERGIAMFPGQSAGANTGPGKLPFPTRPETILPSNLTASFKTSLTQEGTAFVFTCAGDDGTLRYRLELKTGNWSDITATWAPGGRAGGGPAVALQPCVDGGVYLRAAKGAALPDKAEHLGTQRQDDSVESRWRVSAGNVSAEVAYTYRLWNKSLVVDVIARGGAVGEVRFGHAVGLTSPRLVTNPFYPAQGGRPAVAVSGTPEAPLFLTGNADWYLSNGSILWAANSISTNGVVYNGGTRYTPLTHGKRNDCFERFFITVSPRYEEVLPNIPNPVSPWKHITGTRVWRAHGASNREHDKRYWTDAHRWGMTQLAITDHETMWRDGGESFTFRTKAAPGKGGDAGARDYSRFMQDQLGFVYGPYNNFTDFAPVNEFWSFDLIGRTPDNQLQHAWMRCYAPKPARAVEYCAKLAPQIQEKFQFSTAYCDVHTAVAPWHRVDYDPRVPGAGTFAAVFYSYGEIMLHQKKAWNGPVYSEGNYHSFYMGLTDGNYGQDQSYRPAENPWLVDFDLRKMHDLGCNFGMGNLEMFYANAKQPRGTPEERDAEIDRFLAATVAFGHPGFLVMDGGMANGLRSYYMLQQLHSRYCLTNAVEIRYANTNGALIDTSQAVAGGAYQRSQVVTRYADGTITAANGSKTDRLKVNAYGRDLDLPPNGYAGWTENGAIEVLSGDPNGHRSDYAATPAYLYVDGRGRFMRFAKAAGNGIGICRILPKGQYEILLHNNAECGFAVNAAGAVALDKERKELGPAQLRTARGLTYVVPVKGAFSYLLTPTLPRSAELNSAVSPISNRQGAATSRTAPADPRPAGSKSAIQQTASLRYKEALTSDRAEVFAGERVQVRGKQAYEVEIPQTAKPGERIWIEREGAWIDFTVVPLTDLETSLEGNTLRVRLTSNAFRHAEFAVRVSGLANDRGSRREALSEKSEIQNAGARTQSVRLEPRQPGEAAFDLGAPQQESADVLTVAVRLGETAQQREHGVRVVSETAQLLPLPTQWSKGVRLRGHKEQPDFGQTLAHVHAGQTECGGMARTSLAMHPPYHGGTGYVFARYDAVSLPASPPAAFRAVVGKGDGSDLGDGILYQLAVVDEHGTETVVAERTVQKHAWLPVEADLSRWAGQRVALKLIADVGPKDNSSGDWACWADMRIESLRPQLRYVLVENTDVCRHVPGPHPVSGLTVDALRQARSGRLRYDGKGLSGTGHYGTFAVLNGVELGNLAPAGGNETKGIFQANAGVPLTPDAIRSLGRRNRIAICNPNGDSFSIRRFWIELDLADGRKCSSDISTATYTQPPEWLYAEGIGVPGDQELAVDVWIAIQPAGGGRE